jgi:PAS domain S-box-containing protein
VGTLDLDRVSHLIVDAVLRLFHSRGVALYQRDPESGALNCLAMAGGDDPRQWVGSILQAGHGVVGLAVVEGRTVWSPDFLADRRISVPDWLRERARATGHRSVVGVPLIVRGETIGALSLGDVAGRVMTDAELRLLSAFADQAALALDNARMFADTTERLRETETLLAVAQAFSSPLSVQEAMRRVTTVVAGRFGADMGGAYVLDARKELLVPLVGYHVPKDLIPTLLTTPFPVSRFAFLQEAWATRKPVWTSDYATDARFDQDFLATSRPRSLLFVPTAVHGEVVGGLFLVWWTEERRVTPAELRLMEGVASQVGLALENADLDRQTQERLRESELFAELTKTVNAALDLDTVLQRVAEAARELCASDRSMIAIRDAASDAMIVRYRAGARTDAYRNHRVEPGKGVGGQVLLSGRPFRSDNYREDPRITKDYLQWAPEDASVASLAVPIRIGDHIEGLLYAQNLSPRPFGDHDEAILAQLADHAAIAIKNARLFAREQIARAEAEATAHALQTSEERYRVLVEGSIQGMYIHQDRTIAFANAPMARIFGYASPDDLVGGDYLILIAPEERARIEGYRAARLRGEPAPTRYEAEGVAKDGTPLWVEILVSVIPWNGQPAILGTFLDITERKRAQEALERLSRQHQLILASAGEGIYGVDAEGLATFVNPAGATMLGWTLEEIVGRPMHALIHHTTRDGARYPAAACPIHTAFRDGNVHQVEHEVFWRRDGTSFPVEYTSTPILAEDGRLIGAVVTFRDVTEREHLEAQIRQAQKMEAVGQLAGGIAHDFNNLLTVIKGRSELLHRRLKPDAVHARDFDLISKTADRASALIQQLLAFSRKQVLQPRVLDLNAVVSDMSTMLRRLIGERVVLKTFTEATLGHVKADLLQIEQVIVNLIVNGRDAMPEGGQLMLRTANVEIDEAFGRRHPGARRGPHVMLAVSDAGIGMDPDTQARVFEPFFTTKGPGKGSGLGLSTVYGIVEQSNGYIAIESAPGRGSTFTVYLPRVDEAADPLSTGPSAAPGPVYRPATVLVVDDEAAVREVTRDILIEHGYTVLEAADGHEALRLCEGGLGSIHLLVTDVVMPGMSGVELGRRLTRLHPDMKILHMSGYTDTEGVSDFLPKPFAPDTLLAKVQEMLAV